MAITKELLLSWKENRANLRDEISSLKKSISEFKAERKSEWKSFKTKYSDDLNNIEKSMEKLISAHKK